MKLRNKKTGEIFELNEFCLYDDKGFAKRPFLNSLAELNEEWEDYEEPKEYWYVSCAGKVEKATTDEDDYNESHISGHISIGNYFETKEEAEKAVEKLKAWERLKNKGFRFADWSLIDGIRVEVPDDFYDSNDLIPGNLCDDLNLLFGGEK